MKHPEITVLMAVYNGEWFLRESVESILQQSFADFEFLIIDDGSKDGTASILKGYGDSRIRVVENRVNIGLAASLNRGLELARGGLIARIDADDISHSTRLEKQYRIFKAHPEVGLVSSWLIIIDEKGREIRRWCTPLSPEDIFFSLHFGNCIAHSSVMFRKQPVARLGGYNPDIKALEDFELWSRLSRQVKFYQIQDFLLKWRWTEAGISSVYQDEQQENALRLVVERLRDITGEKLDRRVVRSIQNQQDHPIQRVGDLLETMGVLRRTACKIIQSEANRIKALSLKKNKLERLVKMRERRMIIGYFRAIPVRRAVIELVRLRIWMLWALISGLAAALLKRWWRLVRRPEKHRMSG